MNLYFDLFLTFAKVGVCTFGGGYAMLPILQREVVEKKGWATEEELTDYFAIGQCTPGVIAVNTATFIGQKYRGNLGGTIATLGVVFPSLVIITIIAAFLTNFAEIPVVQHALAGINAAVVAMIAVSVLKLGKSTVKDAPSVCIFLAVLVLSELGGLLGVDAAPPWDRRWTSCPPRLCWWCWPASQGCCWPASPENRREGVRRSDLPAPVF